MHRIAVTQRPLAARRLGAAVLVLGLLFWSALDVPLARGVELGLQGGTGISANDENFSQVEITASWPTPWRWRWGGWVQVETRLVATAGALEGGGRVAALGTIGPDFVFSTDCCDWEVTAGSSLSFISRHRFDDEDLGGFLQFTHHIGVGYRVTDRFAVGLRVQHMSNADIYDDNPGVDMAMVSLSYRF